MDYITILVIVIITSMILINYYNKNKDVTTVISTLDKRKYVVAKLPDSQKAADKLAEINMNIDKLLKHCHDPNDDHVMKLINNYDPNVLCELIDKSKYTAYSVNKGEKIAICLRNPDLSIINDINSTMFVIIHELAHIMTYTEQHTPEFWNNMKNLLEFSEKCGVYKPINYAQTPVVFCGTNMNHTPYEFK